MYWECHQSERSETRPDHVLSYLGRSVDATLKKAVSDIPPARRGDIEAIDDCALIRRFYDTWDQLLSIYFNSDLIYVLIAISGITSLIIKHRASASYMVRGWAFFLLSFCSPSAITR